MLENKIDRVWLACFLDTDGSVHLTKWTTKDARKHQRIWLSFHNKNRAILEKVSSLVPGNISYHYRAGIDSRGVKRGDNYTFVVSQAKGISKKVLQKLLPYLIVRKEKANDYLSQDVLN